MARWFRKAATSKALKLARRQFNERIRSPLGFEPLDDRTLLSGVTQLAPVFTGTLTSTDVGHRESVGAADPIERSNTVPASSGQGLSVPTNGSISSGSIERGPTPQAQVIDSSGSSHSAAQPSITARSDQSRRLQDSGLNASRGGSQVLVNPLQYSITLSSFAAGWIWVAVIEISVKISMDNPSGIGIASTQSVTSDLIATTNAGATGVTDSSVAATATAGVSAPVTNALQAITNPTVPDAQLIGTATNAQSVLDIATATKRHAPVAGQTSSDPTAAWLGDSLSRRLSQFARPQPAWTEPEWTHESSRRTSRGHAANEISATAADDAARAEDWLRALIRNSPAAMVGAASIAAARSAAHDQWDRILLHPAPILDLTTSIGEIDLLALESRVQRLINRSGSTSRDQAESAVGYSTPYWLTVFAVTATVCELVHLHILRRGANATGEDCESDSPGSFEPESQPLRTLDP